jgi:8-oxo-dGTP diphosphatase
VSEHPRIRVAALIQLPGGVVVVRHRRGTASYHLLPGGGVDFGETLEAALKREVAEETGLVAEVGPLLFASDTIDPGGTRHVVNLTFAALIVGEPQLRPSVDPRVEGTEIVPVEGLEALDLRPPMANAIKRFVDGEIATPAYLGSLFVPERPGERA